MDSYSFGAASFFLFDFLFFFRGGKRKGDGRLLFNQRADEVVVPFRFDHNDDVIGVKIVEIDGKLICAAEQMHREDTVDAIFRANDAELHDEIFVGDLILRAEEHGDDEHEKKEAHKEEDPVLQPLIYRFFLVAEEVIDPKAREDEACGTQRQSCNEQCEYEGRETIGIPFCLRFVFHERSIAHFFAKGNIFFSEGKISQTFFSGREVVENFFWNWYNDGKYFYGGCL